MCLSTACEAALTQAKQFKQFTFLSVATGICLLIIYTFFDQAKFFWLLQIRSSWRVFVPSFTQIGQNPKEEFEKVCFPVFAILLKNFQAEVGGALQSDC